MNTNFDILETLALKSGHWQNWPLHWARLQITAHHFRYPLMQMQLESDMAQLAQKHEEGQWRVRLALSFTGAVQFTVAQLLPSAEPVKLQLARQPILNAVAQSDVVRFKTSVRHHYEVFEPRSAEVFDTVLFNENGQITEGTRGNIAMQLDGQWVTPALQCGLLPGVGRALALSQGRLVEKVVVIDDLRRITDWAFVNSLRGWLDARLIA